MCGIVGVIFTDKHKKLDEHVLQKMNRSMIHRGPDDEGYFFESGAALAMRRLSILDLEGGKQPLYNEQRKIVSICNGEIFNHLTLRTQLEQHGHQLRSHSDAEILPHLYEEEGRHFVKKLRGMFGLAVWDSEKRKLLIARDRMGQKPLYWAEVNGAFLFASELKALLNYPELHPRLDMLAVQKYLAFEYVPAQASIFEGIHKLEAGHMLTWQEGKISIEQYWDIPCEGELTHISEEDALSELRQRFEEAVNIRLMSDVPLGLFLSGGIDSSVVLAAMAKMLPPQQIKTFSMAFSEKSFDESSHARLVANHFGTQHHEELCTPETLLGLIPEIGAFLDEPLGDASIVPTYALSKFTKKHVTVALGGDGGDELFAGYPTFKAEEYAKIFQRLPHFVRAAVKKIVKHLPVSDENISFDFKAKQFLRGADVLDASKHFLWMGSFSSEEQTALLQARSFGSDLFLHDINRHQMVAASASVGNGLLYLYKKLYLQDDILTKVDRASMAASLECRSPFLDHHFVEFVAKLPYHFKYRHGNLKYLLKKAYENELPASIVNRPKKGFGIPVAKWINGPLREMTCDLLSPARLAKQGIFNPKTVQGLLERHFAQKEDNRKQLWTLLAFQQWHDHYMK